MNWYILGTFLIISLIAGVVAFFLFGPKVVVDCLVPWFLCLYVAFAYAIIYDEESG